MASGPSRCFELHFVAALVVRSARTSLLCSCKSSLPFVMCCLFLDVHLFTWLTADECSTPNTSQSHPRSLSEPSANATSFPSLVPVSLFGSTGAHLQPRRGDFPQWEKSGHVWELHLKGVLPGRGRGSDWTGCQTKAVGDICYPERSESLQLLICNTFHQGSI